MAELLPALVFHLKINTAGKLGKHSSSITFLPCINQDRAMNILKNQLKISYHFVETASHLIPVIKAVLL